MQRWLKFKHSSLDSPQPRGFLLLCGSKDTKAMAAAAVDAVAKAAEVKAAAKSF